MTLTYVPQLDLSQIEQTQRDSHAQWGGSRTLEARLKAVLKFMEAVGPSHLRVEGLVGADGQVVASMKRYTYRLASAPGSPAWKAIGIGAVFTPDHLRKQGHASTLLRHAMEDAKENGFDAALLFSDIDPGFYARLGFSALRSKTAWAKAAAFTATPLATRPATAADRLKLWGWHENAWPATHLRVRRQAESWDMMAAINGGPTFHILSDAGREVGYVATSPEDEGSVWVDEWCVPYAEREKLAARIWATAARLADAQGRVGTWLRPDDDVGPFVEVPRTRAVPMLATLAPRMDLNAAAEHAYFGSLDHV